MAQDDVGRGRSLGKLSQIAQVWAQDQLGQSDEPAQTEQSAKLFAQLGISQDDVEQQTQINSKKPETVSIWPENATIAMIWLTGACRYWKWLSGGMGAPVRIGLDWWRVKNISLDTVPAIYRREDLKKRKARFRYIVEGLEIMEQSALNVFFEHERERQQKEKRKRDRDNAKKIIRP